MQLRLLRALTEPLPLAGLSKEQLKELQRALRLLGYPVGEADGLIGPKTRTAWAEFKTDVFDGNPALIGPAAIEVLERKLSGFGMARQNDFSSREATVAAIVAECAAQDIGSPAQTAYVLATTEWETAKTFRPVKEAFWLSEAWRRKHLRYFPYYGRGFVQLTWQNNYQTYGDLLGLDLVDRPDLALQAEVALFVLCHGFKTGTFTGRRITDYIDDSKTDFVSARRCINGTDHATDIARLAEKYLAGFANA